MISLYSLKLQIHSLLCCVNGFFVYLEEIYKAWPIKMYVQLLSLLWIWVGILHLGEPCTNVDQNKVLCLFL